MNKTLLMMSALGFSALLSVSTLSLAADPAPATDTTTPAASGDTAAAPMKHMHKASKKHTHHAHAKKHTAKKPTTTEDSSTAPASPAPQAAPDMPAAPAK